MWHEARKQEKRIRGMMVDLRKRAERRREYYERIKQDPAQFLQLHGRQCKIHLDPAVAQAADSPATMMPWQGHADNIIDRFDVRAHLDIIPEYKSTETLVRHIMGDLAEEPQTNYERYRVLVQNEFFGIKEDKFLHQIFMEERFGPITRPGAEEEKKKLAEKKAAIGYTYEDSTHPPYRKDKYSQSKDYIKPVDEESEEDEEEDEEDLSDIDFDVSVDVEQLSIEQSSEMNSHGLKYGMGQKDFISFLHQDKDEADQLKIARELEEEKAMYSGRKSRRERRALREKKLQGRRVTSPPSYAAREEADPISKSYSGRARSMSHSKSRSPSPTVAPQITFITSFGGEASDEESKGRLSAPANAKLQSGQNSEGQPRPANVVGPHLPRADRTSRSSSSSFSDNKGKRKSTRNMCGGSSSGTGGSGRHRSSSSSSSSRSSSSSSSSSSRRTENRKRRTKDNEQQKYSQSGRNSRRKNSSRSRSRSRSRSSVSRSSSSSGSHSRSHSRSPSIRGQLSVGGKRPFTPPPIKSYYRHSLSRSGSDIGTLSSEDEEEKGNKSDSSQNVLATRKTAPLFGKAEPSSKSAFTPQERLKRKMQALLNKQYKADKKAALQKQEKQEQERMDRAEELREMAIKLRQRERERRHRLMDYDRESEDSGGGDEPPSPPVPGPSAEQRPSSPVPHQHYHHHHHRHHHHDEGPGTPSVPPAGGHYQQPSPSEDRTSQGGGGGGGGGGRHQSRHQRRSRSPAPRSRSPAPRSRSPAVSRRSGRRSPPQSQTDRDGRNRRYEERNYESRHEDGSRTYEGRGGNYESSSGRFHSGDRWEDRHHYSSSSSSASWHRGRQQRPNNSSRRRSRSGSRSRMRNSTSSSGSSRQPPLVDY